MNYYNENDPKAVTWLRELIRNGHIAEGVVDERSIHDVPFHELHHFKQCHFFAGIGGWSLSLRLAGWPDDEPVWTGSCPCQPFSAAGKGLGEQDPRHLWPVFKRGIEIARPSIVFGEQVASADGRVWLSRVRSDLEAMAYAVGAADLCSAGVGSPNIRQRLYWMAHTTSQRQCGSADLYQSTRRRIAETNGAVGGLADADGWESRNGELQPSGQHGQQQENGGAGRLEHAESDGREQRQTESGGRCVVSGRSACGVGNTDDERSQGRGLQFGDERSPRTPWNTDVAFIHCTDGKTRRTQSGLFPLAHGVPGRVGLLRGYGNAINPYVASEFIQACREVIT